MVIIIFTNNSYKIINDLLYVMFSCAVLRIRCILYRNDSSHFYSQTSSTPEALGLVAPTLNSTNKWLKCLYFVHNGDAS